MTNPLQIITKQIDRQTRTPLHTDYNKASVAGVGSSTDGLGTDQLNLFIPEWVIGKYNLQRLDTHSDDGLGLTVDEFVNYSGKINWEYSTARAINEDNLDQYENVLIGIQLFATRETALKFTNGCTNGILRVYTKEDTANEYTLSYDDSANVNTSFSIPLHGNRFTTIIITFYAVTDNAKVLLSTSYNNVSKWKSMDMATPSVPSWATPALQYTAIEEQSKQGKITLRWKKDTTSSFAGNGIYKITKGDSGISLVRPLPSPLIKELNSNSAEIEKWITVPINSTLNSGDQISVSSTEDANTGTVTKVFTVPKNLVSDPTFLNTTTHWAISPVTTGGGISNGAAKVAATYLRILNTGSGGVVRTVTTAAFIDVTTASVYTVALKHSADKMLRVPYDLEGYKVNPSRWHYAGGITSLTSTLNNYQATIKTERSTAGKIYSTAMSFYASAVSSLSVVCSASCSVPATFTITLRSSAGATIGGSGVLTANTGYFSNTFVVTPSVSGWAYTQINISGTSSLSPVVTLQFKEINIKSDYTKSAGTVLEYLETLYYDSGFTPCATASATMLLGNSDRDITSMTIGTSAVKSTFKFPSTCENIKLRYKSEQIGSSTVEVFRNLFQAVVATSSENIEYCVYATPYACVRSNSNIETRDSGTSLYLQQINHVVDRPRTGSDGSIVTWDDFAVEDNTLYSYYLDAYDKSPFTNRSALSEVASITSGDAVAPKPATNYICSALQGAILHEWVNPTATDLSLARIKNVSGVTPDNIITDLVIKVPEGVVQYTETNVALALATRSLTILDASGNESTAVTATCTPFETDEPSLPFTVALLDAVLYEPLFPIVDTWYDQTVIASMVVEDPSIVVGNYSVNTWRIDKDSTWQGWNVFHTGRYTLGGNYKYKVKFKYDNADGTESLVSPEMFIYVDTQAPTYVDSGYGVWDQNSGGYPKQNLLKWNPDQVTDVNSVTNDSGSGVDTVKIYRANASMLIGNPVFNSGSNGSVPDHWTSQSLTDCKYILYAGESYYPLGLPPTGAHSLKFSILGDSVHSGLLRSSTFDVNNNDIITITYRVKASMSGTNSDKVTFRLSDGSVYANDSGNTISNTGTWEYHRYEYTATSDKPNTYLEVFCDSDGNGTTGDYLLFDEITVSRNLAFTLIDTVPVGNLSYLDTDVQPWLFYMYMLRFVDRVGNVSDDSPYKLAIPLADYREKYGNILDNSSFEKTYTSSAGTLQAHGWDAEFPDGYGEMNTNLDPYEIRSGDAVHGNNYLVIPPKTGITRTAVFQNGVHLLPYLGADRKYVVSGYFKKANSSAQPELIILAYDNESTALTGNYKFKEVTASIDTTNWTRVSATVTIDNPNAAHISVGVGNKSAVGSVFADAIKLEEKDSPPPSEYYDTKSITADYLQGNLIRGHMIVADTIYTSHLQANIITAEKISAGAITATTIKAGAITATAIAANTITTNELKLADTNIWVRDKDDMLLEISSPGTVSSCYPISGTMSTTSKYLCMYYAQHANLGGSLYVSVGNCSNTFNAVSGSSRSVASFNGYEAPVFLAKPGVSDGSSTAIVLARNVSGAMYQVSIDMSIDPYLTGGGGDSGASSISHAITTETELKKGRFIYSALNNAFYFGTPGASSAVYHITKVGSTAYTVTAPEGNIVDGDFAISKLIANTVYIAYGLSASSGLWIRKSTLGGSELDSIEIPTYGGNSSGALPSDAKAKVTSVSLACTSDDYVVIIYRIENNSYTYYKILDSNLNIVIGNNIDLVLTNNQIHYNERMGGNQYKPKIEIVHNDHALFTLVASGGKKFPIGTANISGKGLYLMRTDPSSLNLEDLLNHIA